MIRRANPETDQISRSLLQKAVRRGNPEITKQAISCLLKNNDFDWLRKRLAVVTFEECWTYGSEVSYENDEETVIRHYLKITGAIKNKDAAGLGSLAYVLSQGDPSVLSGVSEDKAIKIIAEAIKRPNDFWTWAKKQELNETQRLLVEKADKGFRKAGWPWDRAFTQAAAYLAISTPIPRTQFIQLNSVNEFPLWVGIDKHTREGKIAIREAAKRVGFNANKALWLAFYFESAKCNAIEDSYWWHKEVTWRMKKLELSVNEANTTWEKIKPIVVELLREETDKLQEKIFKVNLPDLQSRMKQESIF
jgi:hypothetical protein